MKRGRGKGKTMLMTILAIGCMALVLMWPQWRDELRAQVYPGARSECVVRYECISHNLWKVTWCCEVEVVGDSQVVNPDRCDFFPEPLPASCDTPTTTPLPSD